MQGMIRLRSIDMYVQAKIRRTITYDRLVHVNYTGRIVMCKQVVYGSRKIARLIICERPHALVGWYLSGGAVKKDMNLPANGDGTFES